MCSAPTASLKRSTRVAPSSADPADRGRDRHLALSARQIVDRIFDVVAGFRGSAHQNDDMTARRRTQDQRLGSI